MTIATDGNVGIGTTTPSEKLEVNGSVYSNADNSYIGIDAQGESRLGIVKKEDLSCHFFRFQLPYYFRIMEYT